MKTFSSSYFLFLLSGILLLGACGKKKSPSHLKLVPQESIFVLGLNVKQLATKSIRLDELFSEKNLREMGNSEQEAKKTAATAKMVLASGIDFLNNSYLFVNKSQQVGLAFALENEKGFEDFLQNKDFWKENAPDQQAFEIKSAKKIKYVYKKEVLLAWRDKTGLLYIANGKGDEESLLKEVSALFEQEDSKSLEKKNEQFREANQQGSDVFAWLDLQSLSTLSPELGVMGLKDMFFTFNTNFEKGEILSQAKLSMSEEYAKIMEQVSKDGLQGKLSANIGIEKPALAMSLALDLQGLKKVLEGKGLMSLVDMQLKSLNFSFDDLAQALSGDMLVVAESLNMQNGLPELVFSLGIKDEAAFEQLVSKVDDKKLFVKKQNVYEALGGSGYIVLKDKAAYITPSRKLKDAVLKGESKLDKDFNKALSSAMMATYFGESLAGEIAQLSNALAPLANLPANTNSAVESSQFNVSKIKGKVIAMQGNTQMKDKSKNSLLVLIDEAKKSIKELENNPSQFNNPFEETEEGSEEEGAFVEEDTF
jgi:hypothetical protein